MNDNHIVEHMIRFVENKEKEVQADYMKSGSKVKTDVVKTILNELDKRIKDEDQKNRV